MPDLQNLTPRQTFLIERYKLLFAYTRQSMVGIWQLAGLLTIIGSLCAAIHNKYINLEFGSSLIFLIIFWGIFIIIELNQWHRRNLLFLTAIENEFFDPDDYGKLIPILFIKPKQGWISLYLLYLIAFLFLLIIAVISYFHADPFIYPINLFKKYALVVLFFGQLATVLKYWSEEDSAKSQAIEMFQKPEDQTKQP